MSKGTYVRGSAPRMGDRRISKFTKAQMTLVGELNRRGLHPDIDREIPRWGHFHCSKGHITMIEGDKSTLLAYCTTCGQEAKIMTYSPDLHFPEFLIIEIDGDGHRFEKDAERDAFLIEHGYAKKVKHYSNTQALKQTKDCADEIQLLLKELGWKV